MHSNKAKVTGETNDHPETCMTFKPTRPSCPSKLITTNGLLLAFVLGAISCDLVTIICQVFPYCISQRLSETASSKKDIIQLNNNSNGGKMFSLHFLWQ